LHPVSALHCTVHGMGHGLAQHTHGITRWYCGANPIELQPIQVMRAPTTTPVNKSSLARPPPSCPMSLLSSTCRPRA
jgi:hypothetical protein